MRFSSASAQHTVEKAVAESTEVSTRAALLSHIGDIVLQVGHAARLGVCMSAVLRCIFHDEIALRLMFAWVQAMVHSTGFRNHR